MSALEFIDNVKKGGLFVIGDTVTVPAVQGNRPEEVIFKQYLLRRMQTHKIHQFTTVCSVYVVTYVLCWSRYRARRALWKRFLDETGFKAFSEIVLEQEGAPQLGAANLFMSTGLGGLKPNTLVLTLPEQVRACTFLCLCRPPPPSPRLLENRPRDRLATVSIGD